MVERAPWSAEVEGVGVLNISSQAPKAGTWWGFRRRLDDETKTEWYVIKRSKDSKGRDIWVVADQ